MTLDRASLVASLGPVDAAWLCYARDESVRDQAASGGAVSALLLYLIDSGRVDAALVTQLSCADGHIVPRVTLAQNREEILAARTSKYFDVPLLREGLPLLRDFEGRVAVVALPCHAEALRTLCRREGGLAAKIACVVTLLCNHSCKPELLDAVLRREDVDPAEVRDFWFRRGHWRGRMGGRLADGREFSFPFQRFSLYHNLHFFGLRRCLGCGDHTGLAGDLAVGDAWLSEMKREPIKHSIVLARRPEWSAVMDEMFEADTLVGRRIEPETIVRAQKRALIYHRNVSARARAAARCGIAIKARRPMPVRWNEALGARLILLNHRWSRGSRRRWIFKIPRRLMRYYMALMNLLHNW